VLLDELAHLIDGADAAGVAFLLRHSPREQAVSTEDDSVASRVVRDGAAQHQRQFEPGPLPGQPHDMATEALIELRQSLLAIRTRGKRDRPVGMQVIDVIERQKRMQRRVDRCGNPVVAEGGQRVIGHHLVLVRLAAIPRDQRLELVHVQQREA
jgi:hypothetical protein